MTVQPEVPQPAARAMIRRLRSRAFIADCLFKRPAYSVASARSGSGFATGGSPKGLDRAPDPSLAPAPAARASSPLGDFARRDPDCCRVGEARGLSVLTRPRAANQGRREDSGRHAKFHILQKAGRADRTGT